MNGYPGGGRCIGHNLNGEFVPLDKCVERGIMTKERYDAIVKANYDAEHDKTVYEN